MGWVGGLYYILNVCSYHILLMLKTRARIVLCSSTFLLMVGKERTQSGVIVPIHVQDILCENKCSYVLALLALMATRSKGTEKCHISSTV